MTKTLEKEASVLRKEKREWLPCKLSEKELKQHSKDLANAYDRSQELNSQLDTFKAQIKSHLTEVEGNIGRLSSLVSSEIEYRAVDCELIYDFKAGKKTLIRKDTGEVIRTDELTSDERQMEMNI